VASIIGFSIVNVKRARLQRSCGIYRSQRYRYRTCWVIYLTKGRNLIKGAILSGGVYRMLKAAIGDTILEKGIIFSRYWCKSLIRSKGQVDKM
jgi:hypothetical protein